MNLYFNSGKQSQKVIINGVVYSVQLYAPALTGDRLLSLDDFILTDKYGVYLTSQKEE